MADSTEKQLEQFERALDAADASVGADRRAITEQAQADLERAVEYAGIAMDSDEAAAEALRIAIMAERTGDRSRATTARKRERVARKQAKRDHRLATKAARSAYDAVRFSDKTKLGFLRILLILLAINVLLTVVTLTTYIKGSYTFEFNYILNLINVLFDAVIIWLIWKRKKITRPFVIAVALFNIIVGTTFNIVTGSFDLFQQVILSIHDIFLLVYFLKSKRVQATLVEPFNLRALNDDLDEDESFFRPRTWAFWRNLIIYFIVFSIVGHWMEAGVCLLIKYGLVPGTYDPTSQIWSDWLYPFPVYGIGFCACALLLYPLKNALIRLTKRTLPSLILSFIANALVCTIIELVMGLLTNADLQLWDYSDMFCNFMGQVCLQNALFFGLVATIMTWLVYPALERLFRRIPNEAVNGIFIVSVTGCAMLYALYYINLDVLDTGNTSEVAASASANQLTSSVSQSSLLTSS